jgi:hypothetical protein
MSDEVLQLDVEADAAEQAQPLTVVAAGASMEPAPGETKRPA